MALCRLLQFSFFAEVGAEGSKRKIQNNRSSDPDLNFVSWLLLCWVVDKSRQLTVAFKGSWYLFVCVCVCVCVCVKSTNLPLFDPLEKHWVGSDSGARIRTCKVTVPLSLATTWAFSFRLSVRTFFSNLPPKYLKIWGVLPSGTRDLDASKSIFVAFASQLQSSRFVIGVKLWSRAATPGGFISVPRFSHLRWMNNVQFVCVAKRVRKWENRNPQGNNVRPLFHEAVRQCSVYRIWITVQIHQIYLLSWFHFWLGSGRLVKWRLSCTHLKPILCLDS